LRFRYEPAGELPSVVRADRKRLGQILINILGNAVKFTQRGGIVLRVRYARDQAVFEIEDTGVGILPDEAEQIFEPFSRGSAGNQPGAPGTGLGLPISKLLVQLMGGQLTWSSTPGSGTTFQVRLRLPRLHCDDGGGAGSAATRPAARTGYAGARRKILVVDNERVDRELLVDILAPLGFETAQAATGQECLERYTGFQPDLILMDLAMPGMDGWEASSIIRTEHGAKVPILIVSANAYDRGLENPAGIAFEDFIVKPVNVAELLERIGRRLQLEWTVQLPAQLAENTAPMRFPPAARLEALRSQLEMGYVRGVQRQLDEIAALGPEYTAFLETMRALAAGFDLEAMARFLEHGEHNASQPD
jgi:CheY-like chemotaxis protein/anti-sigma regulatory factor (Ser/Thr protein kinase)